MAVLHKIDKQTDNKYVNLYNVNATNRVGDEINYSVASRSRTIEGLKLVTHTDEADAVVMFAIHESGKLVLIKQFRFPAGEAIIELPAGLVDSGESLKEAAVREMKEETGLDFVPIDVDPMFEKAFFTSCGFSDETVSMIYGVAKGEISYDGNEGTEEIEVILADREEARKILGEEKIALMCAYPMMHFIADEDPFAFLK